LTETLERMAAADAYLNARVATYEQRCQRFDVALEAMHAHGLTDTDTVVDVGAGHGHFGVRLHTGRNGSAPIPSCRARYVPVDAALDGTDLDDWTPPRPASWFVALEILEHLYDPARLIAEMADHATKGVVVSTPNPRTVDVLACDSTHVTAITAEILEAAGFVVSGAEFYGRHDDSLFAVMAK
jgi:trans-aconitate methyltransferase